MRDGRTPWTTFEDANWLAEEKLIDNAAIGQTVPISAPVRSSRSYNNKIKSQLQQEPYRNR